MALSDEGPPDVVALVDSATPNSVVVTGSLPPEGGDLDLLVDADGEEVIAAALDAADFLNRSRSWVRFAGERVDAVELFRPADFRLPPSAFDELAAAGTPLPGRTRVLRPSPHHVLLILTLRSIQHGSRLDERHRGRVDEEVARDDGAWERAAEVAPSWRLSSALRAMRRAHAEGRSLTMEEQRVGRAEWLEGATDRPPRARRGAVIALCGLDGSGKSTQATLLRDNLDRVGYDAVVVWSRLEWDTLVGNRVLHAVAAPVKAALRVVARSKPTEVDTATAEEPRGEAGSVTMYRARSEDSVVRIRQQSALLTGIWVAVLAISHGVTTYRRLRPHLRAGRVVVCDRYTVDTAVFLRHIYGSDRHFRLAGRVLRRVSPPPLVTWFLDVPPSVALSRKQDEFDLEELAHLRHLYVETHGAFAALRLNGALGSADLAATIARHTWLLLP